MSAFLTRLVVEWMDAGHWRLVEPLEYRSDVLGALVSVPAGFRTDFASVPRMPLAYLIAGNRGHRAATVHDYLYTVATGTRADADAVLREALPLDGVPAEVVTLMYTAVRDFGAPHWRGVPDPPPVMASRSGEVIEGP